MRRINFLLCFLLAACAAPTTSPPQADHPSVSRERVWEQGDNAKNGDNFDETVEAVYDPVLKKRMRTVFQPIRKAAMALCADMHKNPYTCDYTYKVLWDSKLNAYADGKKVYITTAMIAFTERPEELAFVLAHEYAHNIMRHVAAQKTNAVVGALFGAVLDGVLDSGDTFTELGKGTGALVYSQSFESEADYVGLYIAARAGFNVEKALPFWRRFAGEAPSSTYVSITHPTTPERYVAMERSIDEIREKQKAKKPLLPNFKGEGS